MNRPRFRSRSALEDRHGWDSSGRSSKMTVSFREPAILREESQGIIPTAWAYRAEIFLLEGRCSQRRASRTSRDFRALRATPLQASSLTVREFPLDTSGALPALSTSQTDRFLLKMRIQAAVTGRPCQVGRLTPCSGTAIGAARSLQTTAHPKL
jgi:hypothetical protein